MFDKNIVTASTPFTYKLFESTHASRIPFACSLITHPATDKNYHANQYRTRRILCPTTHYPPLSKADHELRCFLPFSSSPPPTSLSHSPPQKTPEKSTNPPHTPASTSKGKRIHPTPHVHSLKQTPTNRLRQGLNLQSLGWQSTGLPSIGPCTRRRSVGKIFNELW